MWVRVGRGFAVVSVLCALLFVPASPATAHGGGGAAATNLITTLSALTPAVPGVRLSVTDHGDRLELINDTAIEVMIPGYDGEPYARVGPAGVFLNDHSPATYLNEDRFASTRVPAVADASMPPSWRKVADEARWRWHDHRVHWMVAAPPTVVTAEPDQPHRISEWTVTLDYGGQRLTATGSLDWVPGSRPRPWFGLAALLVGGLAAVTLSSRPHRMLALATGALLAVEIIHGFGMMLATVGTGPERLSAFAGSDALLVWPFTILATWLLWRRHTRAAWLAAGVGLLFASTHILDNALWGRASAPTALPVNLNGAVVAIIVGLGLGLVVVLPLLLYRHRPPSRPWARADIAAVCARQHP